MSLFVHQKLTKSYKYGQKSVRASMLCPYSDDLINFAGHERARISFIVPFWPIFVRFSQRLMGKKKWRQDFLILSLFCWRIKQFSQLFDGLSYDMQEFLSSGLGSRKLLFQAFFPPSFHSPALFHPSGLILSLSVVGR